MSGITLALAETNLAAWIAASEAVAQKQSYTIGDRTLTYVNAEHITKMIEFWDGKVKALGGAASGRTRIRYLVPE